MNNYFHFRLTRLSLFLSFSLSLSLSLPPSPSLSLSLSLSYCPPFCLSFYLDCWSSVSVCKFLSSLFPLSPLSHLSPSSLSPLSPSTPSFPLFFLFSLAFSIISSLLFFISLYLLSFPLPYHPSLILSLSLSRFLFSPASDTLFPSCSSPTSPDTRAASAMIGPSGSSEKREILLRREALQRHRMIE